MKHKFDFLSNIHRMLLPVLVVLAALPATAGEETEMPAAASSPAEETGPSAAQTADQRDTDGKEKAENDEAKPQKGSKWGGRRRDHAKQGFVNILAGTGYYLVVPYDKDVPTKMCAPDKDNPMEGRAYCAARVGWFMDFSAGYGLKPGFELFMMFRLGLERPNSDGLVNQPLTRQLGVGIKAFTPKDGFFKLGIGLAPLVDFSDRGAAGVRPDLVIHVPIQALFDIFPWFGAYAQIAPNFSFIAEFKVEFTGGIGVQGRFP